MEKAQKMVERNLVKAKKEIAKAEKNVVDYIKKNPEKSAAIAAGIGAALGAAATAFLKSGGKKKRR